MKECRSLAVNFTWISEALRCVSLNRSTSTAHAAVSDPAADPSVEACSVEACIALYSVLLAVEGTLIVPFVLSFVWSFLVTFIAPLIVPLGDLLGGLLIVLLTEFEAAAT